MSQSCHIVFMHGLESGLKGKKSMYLHQNFPNTYTPDMQMSLFNFSKKHSVIRNIFRCRLFYGWLLLSILTITGGCYLGGVASVLGAVLCLIGFVAIKTRLIHQALDISLEQCIAVQSEVLVKFKPDLIVGSSWGGLVALSCVTRNVYSCPVVLIAPPVKMVLNKIDSSGKRWSEMQEAIKALTDTVYVVHGDCDTTVPLEDSHELASQTTIDLQVIPQGDHSLNSTLLQDNPYSLVNIIHALLEPLQNECNL